MITPAEITSRAARHYLLFLQNWLRDEPFHPISWPAGRPDSNFATLRAELQALQAREKSVQSPGYRLEYQESQTRAFGWQTLPTRIWLDTPPDLLHLLGKTEEFDRFRQDVALMREQVPELISWVERSPHKLIEQHDIWSELLLVCRYFRDHPRPGLYIRELPINVHTKFIEQHQGILRELLDQILPPAVDMPRGISFQQRYGLREEEPQVRVRFLDGQLEELYHIPCDDLSLPCSRLELLNLSGQRCIITENKMTFLTLPPLERAFALLGSGFQVSNLVNVHWLASCPIIYWGDLDAQGFQILSQLRSIFPHVTSLMMDTTTLNAFAAFSVPGTPCRIQHLPNLTDTEHQTFLHLARTTIRLEQEHISQSYILEQIRQCANRLDL